MQRRVVVSALVMCVAGGVGASEARAQSRQAISLNVGYFALRAEDARTRDDVLAQNLSFLLFQLKDFNGIAVGGDWLVVVGDRVEVGAGIGVRRRVVPSVYTDYVDIDGSEIAQEMKLRVTPVTFTVRLLPFGQESAAQPYIGAGLGLYVWRYAEVGEFVDFRDFSIFRGSYVDTGATVGSVILGGVRFPVGQTASFGMELQHHGAIADLDPAQDFSGTKVDLSGWATYVTVRFRF